MGVDQTGQNHVTREIDDVVGSVGQLGGITDLDDHTVTGKEATIGYLSAIHGDESLGMTDQQGSHRHQVTGQLRVGPHDTH